MTPLAKVNIPPSMRFEIGGLYRNVFGVHAALWAEGCPTGWIVKTQRERGDKYTPIGGVFYEPKHAAQFVCVKGRFSSLRGAAIALYDDYLTSLFPHMDDSLRPTRKNGPRKLFWGTGENDE